jgi:hypothetical protein
MLIAFAGAVQVVMVADQIKTQDHRGLAVPMVEAMTARRSWI